MNVRLLKFEFIDLLLSSLASKAIDRLLSYSQIKKLLPKKPKKVVYSSDLINFRKASLQSIYYLTILPYFDLPNPATNQILIASYIDTAIKLIEDFGLGDEDRLRYHLGNLGTKYVSDPKEIIGYLKREKEIPSRNDSPYFLGFRSVFVILDDNIEDERLDSKYIAEIKYMLKPFFEHYMHKEYLIASA